MLPPPTKKSRWDKQDKSSNKNEAIMIKLEGRVFPVEIAYLDEPTADVVMKAVETIYDIHLKVGLYSLLLSLFCAHIHLFLFRSNLRVIF